MEFLSAPYEVRQSDLAGPTRLLSSPTLESAMWEDLLTDARAATAPESMMADVVFATTEHYTRAIKPVRVGESVGLLLSLSIDQLASRVCTFLRVVGQHGDAIACSFTTRHCVSRATGDLAPLPPGLAGYFANRQAFTERLSHSEFARLAAPESNDGIDVLFDEQVRASGARAALGNQPSSPPPRRSMARRSGILALPVPEVADLVVPGGGVGFTFPGEQSYDGALLRELYSSYPYLSAHFDQADAVARRSFRHAFLPLVEIDSPELHDQRVARCPELTHLGVVVCALIIAETLQEQGVRPDVLVAQGAGVLAALSVAGSIDLTTALRLAAERALVLRDTIDAESRRRRLAAAITGVQFNVPRVQLLMSSDGKILTAESSIADALLSELENHGDLRTAIATVRSAGCEHVITCGPGGILTRGGIAPTRRVGRSVPAPRKSVASGITAVAASIGGRATTLAASSSPDANTRRSGRKPAPAEPPVAIVGLGCVVPGAGSSEQLWQNVLRGRVKAVRQGESGTAWPILTCDDADLAYDSRLPFSEAEYDRLTRTQRLLAQSFRQVMNELRLTPGSRARCLIGMSAESVSEAALSDTSAYAVARIDSTAAFEGARDSIARGIAQTLGVSQMTDATLHDSLRLVVERFLGSGTPLVIVDAACASSLFALSLAVRELSRGDADLVVVGGVATPTTHLTELFEQMGLVSQTECLPFDERADGTVFAEGAAVLAVERLNDAFDAGHRIRGIVRAVGLSSDGRGPGVSTPRPGGQLLALERAYNHAGLQPGTVQFIEAHGIGAPGFDAAELEALRVAFGEREPSVVLGSVKPVAGHTGAASGAVSMVKVCRALEEHVLPPQPGATPAARLLLPEGAPLVIPDSAAGWKPHGDGVPRRAGVSTFAFGGNNAHALVEGFTPLVHVRSAGGRGVAPRGDPSPLAIVGFASIFPAAGSQPVIHEPPNDVRRFGPAAIQLPRQAHLLTDVEKQLDVTQLLALAAAERAIASADRWSAYRERIGVIFGLRGRTPRAVAIAHRHHGRALRQRLRREPEAFGLTSDEARVADLLWPGADADEPIDAYTLMGLMPNVAASRVAHTYDFNGPSLCMDAGACTLVEIMRAVEHWLLADEVDMMLAGALSVDVLRHATSTPGVLEGACVVALATAARARANAWPIHGYLAIPRSVESPTIVVSSADGERPSVTGQPREVVVRQSLTQVVGLAELARAGSQVARGQGGASIALRWSTGVASARLADTAEVGAMSPMPLAIAREHRADAST